MIKKIKHLCTIALLVCATPTFAQQTFNDKYYRNGAYIFNDATKFTKDNIFTQYRSEFHLGTDDQMLPKQTIVNNKHFFIRFNQYHKGYKIENTQMSANGYSGLIKYLTGNIVEGLNLSTTNNFTEATALEAITNQLGNLDYKWLNTDYVATLREELEDPTYDITPHGELLYVRMPGEYTNINDAYKLAWQFQIEARNPNIHWVVNLDANTGDIIHTQDAGSCYNYNNSGSGWTLYNGSFQNLGTGNCNLCSRFSLKSNKGITTWNDMPSVGQYPDILKDNNNSWVENSAFGCSNRKTGVSAHWALERAHDYYLSHGKWGSNFQGMNIECHINFQNIGGNISAQSISTPSLDRINFGEDDNSISMPSATNQGLGYSFASLDIVGHEYNHNHQDRSSNLVKFGESGALREGLSDIFGALTEVQVFGNTDWKIGEFSKVVRFLDNPASDYVLDPSLATIIIPGQPATANSSSSVYHDIFWRPSNFSASNPPTAGNPDISIHANGGVLRKWFYLLANGGTFNGVTVTGIGVQKAEKLIFIVSNWWLWSGSNYDHCANATKWAIEFHPDIFGGKCSAIWKSNLRAWKAVGININEDCQDGGVIIKGDDVLSHDGTYNNLPFIAQHDNSENPIDYQYEWQVPQGWSVTTQGNTLYLQSVSDFQSKTLTVKCTPPVGSPIYVSKVVHFSDIVLQGDNLMPPPVPSTIIAYNMTSQQATSAIRIYPNPAQSHFTVEYDNLDPNATLVLFDQLGRKVSETVNLQKSGRRVNIENLSNGIYFYQIASCNEVFSGKLIKN